MKKYKLRIFGNTVSKYYIKCTIINYGFGKSTLAFYTRVGISKISIDGRFSPFHHTPCFPSFSALRCFIPCNTRYITKDTIARANMIW